MTLPRTGSQTIGPFYNFALMREGENDLTRRSGDGATAAGETVEIAGQVRDGTGAPCTRVLVELWQADAEGRHGADRDPNFRGFGRTLTNEEGRYAFTTVIPGQVPGKGNAWQAPHISLSLFGSGLLKRVTTRLYFPDHSANAEDPVLTGIEDGAARSTLIAREISPGPPRQFGFDIVLQGEGETTFFSL